MRRAIIVLLMLGMLTACAGQAPGSVSTEELTPSIQESTVLSEAAPQTVTFQVKTEVYEDTALADDGTELVTCRFEYPVLRACWRDGTPLETAQTAEEEQALTAVETFNNQFGPATVGIEYQEMVSMAQEDLDFRLESDMVWTSPYTMEMDCEVYQTEQMISISGNYYSYTGGAHPNTVLLAWNFDLTTGQFFTPEVLAADGQAFSAAVKEELVRQSRLVAAENDLEPEKFFWANYEEILSAWTSYAVSFDSSGMTVAFSPYELAAYVVGAQVYYLDYTQLMPYLSPHGVELLGLESTEGEVPSGK